ncbi:MAG: DUF4300 family protein [Anaerovoracaceae bacterium]
MKKYSKLIVAIAICAVFVTGSNKTINPKAVLEGSNLANVGTYLRYMTEYKNGKVPKQDYNCRTAAFTLLEGNIRATPPKTYNNYLMMDVDAIETDSTFKHLKNHKGEFIAVFDGASVAGIPKSKFEKVYPKALKKRNVKFTNKNASLVSVVMHDPYEKWLFVGHAGVLVKTGKKLVFFEKLAPNDDYQIKTFTSKSALKGELQSRSAYQGEKASHKPMIYENGTLMK